MAFGGLELPDLPLLSISTRLHFLLHHLKTRDMTGRLLEISIEWTQLELGSSTHILNTTPIPSYVTSTWVTALCNVLSPFALTFRSTPQSPPPRQNDMYLMDLFRATNLSHTQLQSLNYCRLFLRVVFISDITDAAGQYIDLPYRGHPPTIAPRRLSTYRWPNLTKPPTSQHWEL